MPYSDIFRKAWVKTINLQNKELYDLYVKAGYKYIRKLTGRPFESYMRTPTIGCTVELFFVQEIGCVLLDSAKGRKLINKLCYF
jgi:hypothetical protein